MQLEQFTCKASLYNISVTANISLKLMVRFFFETSSVCNEKNVSRHSLKKQEI